MTIREKLASGRPVLGTWCLASDAPGIGEAFAAAGFDFVYIDTQHSTFSLAGVAACCAAVRAAGAVPIVRPESPTAPLTRLLDNGAEGVIVPDIDTPEAAARVVAEAQYPPLGQRSVGYRGLRGDTEGALVVIQLETAAGVERVDEILAVPGIDVAVIGRNDLAADLGVPGQLEHPEVSSRVERLIAAARVHGVVPGLLQPNARSAYDWRRRGIQWLPIGSDIAFVKAGASAVLDEFRALDSGTAGEGSRG